MPSSLPPESDVAVASRVSVEIRMRAVPEVHDVAPIVDVAERFGVSGQTVTAWRKRYETAGLEGLSEISRRPHSSPDGIAPEVEAWICEMRRHHRRWGSAAHRSRTAPGNR